MIVVLHIADSLILNSGPNSSSAKHRKIFRNRSGFRAAETANGSGRRKTAEKPVCLTASTIFSLPRPPKRGRNLGHGDNMIAALIHKPLRRIVVTVGVNRLREHEKVRIVEGEEK